ncbi:FeoB-associated Cys-rich membrane protein [Cerasicoccus frondis]|nr:FeoB-associated Cys-rich membrane protein [Cerasicoccus frondis]
MFESIVVAVIVLAAAAYLFNNWRKSTKGKKSGCGGKDCGCGKTK